MLVLSDCSRSIPDNDRVNQQITIAGGYYSSAQELVETINTAIKNKMTALSTTTSRTYERGRANIDRETNLPIFKYNVISHRISAIVHRTQFVWISEAIH